MKRFLLILILLCFALPDPSQAGLFGRLGDAGRAFATEAGKTRCWVVIPPIRTDEGYEAVCLQLLTGSPDAPGMIVRFPSTEGDRISRKVGAGDLLTFREFRRSSDVLPVVECRRGWRSKSVPQVSAQFERWGYLVGGRILLTDPERFERFFDDRPDLLALFRRDVDKAVDVLLDAEGGDS